MFLLNQTDETIYVLKDARWSNEAIETVNDVSSPAKSSCGYCSYLWDTRHIDNDDKSNYLEPANHLNCCSLPPWVLRASTYCTVSQAELDLLDLIWARFL